MNTMNSEIKKIVEQLKTAQAKFEALLKNQDWIEDARKYAERQGKEMKKLLRADISKVKVFLERERKELERFQKQIPGEVKKLKQFAKSQRKELQRLLSRIAKESGAKTGKKKKAARKRPARKKSASAASS